MQYNLCDGMKRRTNRPTDTATSVADLQKSVWLPCRILQYLQTTAVAQFSTVVLTMLPGI